MLCKPTSRRRTLQRRLARRRAGGVKSCADSKQIRSCKTLRQPTCSPDKSRTESDKSSIKLAFRYHGTQQYSITALTDSSGTIKERYAYDAYGNLSIFDGSGTARTTTAEGNRYAYTGREWDEELELYHFRARMYDPVCGRFCAKDLLGYVDGQNAYANYFAILRVDPTGLLSQDLVGIDGQGNFIWKRTPENTCYIRTATGEVDVRCPITPPSHPNRIDYLDGLRGIYNGISKLQAACKNCQCDCTEAECNTDSILLVKAWLSAWQANFSSVPDRNPIRVGGWYCYDWAQIFESAFDRVGSKCFTKELRASSQGKPPKVYIHVWLTVTVGSTSASNCQVSLDNGFGLIEMTYSGGQPIAHPFDPDKELYWSTCDEDRVLPFPVWSSTY
ncbi:tRNA nuclease WapA precursor [Stieleria neptunia]|uniref:tRNA nuclease WapA n=1 Tax=Stieleria neptunia TaxID=2527979 RepID=A0A518HXX1_9BACT|nr:RHS repeat-associated core domain-containing protein [Stieleria neptunia]QDV45604.1 tRNA nuclease WapA precursor [Stieleria neptunia]